jgi:hypothetical protein
MGLLMIRTTERLLILAKTFSVLQKRILQKIAKKLLRPEAEKWRPRQMDALRDQKELVMEVTSKKLCRCVWLVTSVG